MNQEVAISVIMTVYNVELYLNVDNKESFSVESNHSDSNDNEFETEEEKKDRISIQNAQMTRIYPEAQQNRIYQSSSLFVGISHKIPLAICCMQ